MSLLKSKPCWNGILVAVFFAMTASVMAFTPEGMRLWKPYQPEQFGGQRRDADGVYGSVEAIYWKVSNQKNTDNFVSQIPIDSNYFNTDFGLGTRITFGNQKGHHGWRISGYGISGLGGSIDRGGDIDFSQQEKHNYYPLTDDDWWWGGADKEEDDPKKYEYGGNGLVYYTNFMNVKEGKQTIFYDTKVMDLELAWTYRAHPFSWGTAEFFVGAKYWNFEDSRSYLDEAKRNLYSFGFFEGATANLNSGQYFIADGSGRVVPLKFDNNGVSTNATEVTPAVLVYSSIENRKVTNHITGPHIGFNLSRRNARWTFNTGVSFFAGINQQSYLFENRTETSFQTKEEKFLSYFSNDNRNSNNNNGGNTDASSLTLTDLVGILKWMREDFNAGVYTKYHRNRTVFSPGVDLQLSAKWQWTDAVGFRVGFDSTITDNVGRSGNLVVTRTSINDVENYTYGFRGKGELVILYGVSFGIEIRR